MRKFSIVIVSAITLTFLTGCILFDGTGVEGTSVTTSDSSSGTSSFGDLSTSTTNSSNSSSLTTGEIPTTSKGEITEGLSGSISSSGETSSGENSGESSSSDSSFSSSSGFSSSSETTNTLTECGNNILESGEECDEGNSPSRTCYKCTLVKCGDHIVTPNEECDEGVEGTGSCTPFCKVSFCGDGLLNSLAKEQCDDGNKIEYDSCSNDCFAPKWVFLSKNVYSSKFGGIGEANIICQKDAQAAGLAGTYSAWISDMFVGNSPNPNWLNIEFQGWYRMPSDPPSLFAKGFGGLSNPGQNPLNVLANGTKNASLTKAWTATTVLGKKNEGSGNCNSWQDMGFGMNGGIGNPQAIDKTWTDLSAPLCGSIEAGIYCFEK